jgi:bifunctional non-homologous end joining protein LigD
LKPLRFRPMLPVDEPVPPNDEGFIHEIKWDGYRALAYLDERGATLESRNGRNLNSRFPNVAEALKELGIHAVVDGEIVAFSKEGQVDFSLLRSRKPDSRICYVVFDLLSLRGEDLCPRPWLERRQQLETMVQEQGRVFLSPLLPGSASECLTFAAEHRLEGIVSKLRDSPYLPGVRSRAWRKQKIRRSLDCILAGVRMGQGKVRSLAAAVYTKDRSLLYLGNVGSGFSESEMDFVRQAMDILPRAPRCPCLNPPQENGSWQWYQPLAVFEVEYSELTPAKRLRHPVFLRFRLDKEAKECVLEKNYHDN